MFSIASDTGLDVRDAKMSEGHLDLEEHVVWRRRQIRTEITTAR